MELTIGQQVQLPKDYRITTLGLKTLTYKLVSWTIIEKYGERIILKYKNIEHDTYKKNIIEKLEFLKTIN